MKSALGLLLGMAACAPVAPAGADEAAPVQGSAGRKCDAGPVQSLTGQPASGALGAEAMRRSGSATLRWIPEGAAVTMDYSESRLNIQLDRDNLVVKISCG